MHKITIWILDKKHENDKFSIPEKHVTNIERKIGKSRLVNSVYIRKLTEEIFHSVALNPLTTHLRNRWILCVDRVYHFLLDKVSSFFTSVSFTTVISFTNVLWSSEIIFEVKISSMSSRISIQTPTKKSATKVNNSEPSFKQGCV